MRYKYIFLIRLSKVDKRVCVRTVKTASLQLHTTSGPERTALALSCKKSLLPTDHKAEHVTTTEILLFLTMQLRPW